MVVVGICWRGAEVAADAESEDSMVVILTLTQVQQEHEDSCRILDAH